ncbi:alpha/beta hydrolase [Actinoplanes sp. NPDC026619]|uniref:alpha/beta fold hydrolase n=1 Tax=Actinoplanes sp. NPDC026619 TaxID=3155798 RepID=UPI00340C354F
MGLPAQRRRLRPGGGSGHRVRLRALPGAPAGDVDLYLKRSTFLTSFATGGAGRHRRTALRRATPARAECGHQPSGPPAWKTIPSWYLVGTQDKIITPAQQRFMAQRAGARTVQVRAGHLCPWSRTRTRSPTSSLRPHTPPPDPVTRTVRRPMTSGRRPGPRTCTGVRGRST